MVEEFHGVACGEALPLSQQLAEEDVCAIAEQGAFARQPRHDEFARPGFLAQEVEHGAVGFLSEAYALEPQFCEVGAELVGGHQHACQQATFANVLLPEGEGEAAVVWQGGGKLLKARQFDAEVYFVGESALAHGLADGAIHHCAQFLLDLAYLVGDGLRSQRSLRSLWDVAHDGAKVSKICKNCMGLWIF